MRHVLLALAAGSLLVMTAAAQDTPAPEQPALSDQAKALLENLDADGDGVLTLEEVPEQQRKFAKRYDKDGDGKLAAAELEELAKLAATLREGASTKRRADVAKQMKAEYAADEATGLYLQAAHDYHKATNGQALLILKDGKAVFEACDAGWQKDMQHELASGTKSFIGVIAACAVDDGLFGWDDKVCDTITEWKEDQRKDITVRMLLSLCAGLPASKEALQGPGVDDKYKYAIGLKCKHEPGTRFEYGPAQYFAFGEFMKRKLAPAKENIRDYFMRRIGDHIGIDFTWRTDKAGNHLMPHGIFCSATEWAKFGEFVRNKGKVGDKQLLKPEHLDECFKPSKRNADYGLTWWLGGSGGDGETAARRRRDKSPDWMPADLVYAAGLGKQRLIVTREKGLTIVRLAKDTATFEDEQFLSWLARGKAAD